MLGHHPHVVSGIELYKDRYVFYDLGSVQSSGKHFRYHNMVARITLEVDTQTADHLSAPGDLPRLHQRRRPAPASTTASPSSTPPDDPGYETVFNIIDSASSHKKITPGPYQRGVL